MAPLIEDILPLCVVWCLTLCWYGGLLAGYCIRLHELHIIAHAAPRGSHG